MINAIKLQIEAKSPINAGFWTQAGGKDNLYYTIRVLFTSYILNISRVPDTGRGSRQLVLINRSRGILFKVLQHVYMQT